MIHARPNLNGNEAKDFRKQAHQLMGISIDIEETMRHIASDVMHGRNYQTLEDPETKRQHDLAMLSDLGDAARTIRNFAAAIYDAQRETVL